MIVNNVRYFMFCHCCSLFIIIVFGCLHRCLFSFLVFNFSFLLISCFTSVVWFGEQPFSYAARVLILKLSYLLYDNKTSHHFISVVYVDDVQCVLNRPSRNFSFFTDRPLLWCLFMMLFVSFQFTYDSSDRWWMIKSMCLHENGQNERLKSNGEKKN